MVNNDFLMGYGAGKAAGGGGSTLITKTITANGTYAAEDDNADGYSEVTVDVAGSGSRTVWYRPPDWPDLSTLDIPVPTNNVNHVYLTIDTTRLPADRTVYSNYLSFTIGHIDNSTYVADYTAVQVSGNIYKIELPLDTPRYVVARYAQSGYNEGRGLYSVTGYTLPVVEFRWAKGTQWAPFYNYAGAQVVSVVNPDRELVIAYPSSAKVLIYENGASATTGPQKLANLFQNMTNLEEIYFQNQSAKVRTGIGSVNSMCAMCTSLRSLDMSWLTLSGISNLGSTFDYCYALTDLNLSNWDMSSCTNMTNTFRQCYSLTNVVLDNAVFPALPISFSNSNLLTDSSLVNIANALPVSTGKTIKLHATPKGRCSSIMGNVVDDFFTADPNGTVTLAEFITNTKGWTLA